MSNDAWKHRSDNMKCKTCMWFVPKEGPREPVLQHAKGGGLEAAEASAYDLGRCRRHSPTMGGYPVVMVNDWCGDHRLDENKYRAG